MTGLSFDLPVELPRRDFLLAWYRTSGVIILQ